ncbi:hypothetical protein PLICRDRAFT_49077 [Plicaturopsis crispa FD-325 SS-3]|nr:hypothetical protein PLICRDRAFT_49077 [Plicaturopsis crispa FD-325 SS-3]
MPSNPAGLTSLPVELLYEVQLYALSSALPLVCTRLHAVFKSTPASFRAQYLLLATLPPPPPPPNASSPPPPITTSKADTQPRSIAPILRYPLCTQPVLEAALRLSSRGPPSHLSGNPSNTDGNPSNTDGARKERKERIVLPKHLFRLAPRPESEWTDDDHPLPFLRYLFDGKVDCNAHSGYALTKAVYLHFLPLVRFLLERGASPAYKGGLAVLVAIRQRNLGVVRMLIERGEGGMERGDSGKGGGGGGGGGRGKRRKLGDRMEVNAEMLRAAVKWGATDIVHYLSVEKGCVPDMHTLRMMR